MNPAPHPKKLQQLGYIPKYCGDGVPPEIEAGYDQIKAQSRADHQAYHDEHGTNKRCTCNWCELTRFDRQQGRRDWVYKQRTVAIRDTDGQIDTEQVDKVNVLNNLQLPDTPMGHKLRQIGSWLIDGYSQTEIAEMLDCSQSSISQLIERYVKPVLDVYAPFSPPGWRRKPPEYDMRYDYTGLYDKRQVATTYRMIDPETDRLIEPVQASQTHDPRQMGPKDIYKVPCPEDMRQKSEIGEV